MLTIPYDILPFFTTAGWRPDRAVPLADRARALIPTDHPAREVLASFEGLTIGQSGSGKECATSDISFEFVEDLEDQVRAWNGLLRTHLVGVAEIQNRHSALFVDTVGRLFGFSYVDDTVCNVGDSFIAAMRGLLFGLRCRPLLRHDQESVMVYGVTYTANIPEVYRYEYCPVIRAEQALAPDRAHK